MRRLWLRWTGRDLRQRWLQVLSTALILAVGIGAWAGLRGLERWRELSADRSLTVTRAHDLRVDLADGDYVKAGRLRGALATLPSGAVGAAEERLIAESQVDASQHGRAVLVPARLIGVPVRAGGQSVDAVPVKAGSALTPGRDAAVLDWNFAHHYKLAPSGRVRIAGLGSFPYGGLGVSPQYFLVVGDGGFSGAESSLALIYLPLADAQRAAGRPGAVNELLVLSGPGRDTATVERAVRQALATALPGVGYSVTRGPDEAVTRILYRDARNDQKTYTAFAVLLLVGAALASFNLVSRVVEAQRREIGIGMALGMEPRLLALRPLAFGLQIGLLGAALGVPVGIGLSELIKSLFKAYLPLPAYGSTFPTALYLQGALIGIALPLLAAALPVVRAVAVQPVDAIRTGHRAAKGAGATAALRRLSLPGRALVQLPLRNLARTPRRTLMTLVGLGAVITAVVAVLGMIDSIRDVADRQEAAVLSTSRNRLEVTLSGFSAANGDVIRRLSATPGVAAAEPGLIVNADVRTRRSALPVVLRFADPRSRIWHPKATSGTTAGRGIVLAEKAARDLGVSVGDEVVLRHPRRNGSEVALADTRLRVIGLHGNPIRSFAYIDAGQAPALGLGGLADALTVVPEPGISAGALERALFGARGVATVRPASADTEALRIAIETFRSMINLVAAITLALALLVAFTSTSVSVDERRREYATMFAFGLPPRSGLRVAMTESLATGLLGTALGIGLGLVVASWIVGALLPDTFPDLSARMAFSGASLATTLLVGILAVTVAPLMAYRRLRKMDVPSTLRVME